MKPVLLHKDSIKIGKRMRTEMGDITGLAQSINEVGLIQPLVIDSDYNLIAGGRRYTAMTTVLGWLELPVVLGDTEGDEAKLRMMELEENVRRKDMSWKEKVLSVAEVHRLRNKAALAVQDAWTQKHTGELLGISAGNVNYSLEIARILNNATHAAHKRVLDAESLTNAFQILIQMREDLLNAQESAFVAQTQKPGGNDKPGAVLTIDQIMKGQTTEVKSDAAQAVLDDLLNGDLKPIDKQTQIIQDRIEIELSKYLLKGDSIVVMNSMLPESVDHIVTDPPYGIDMDNLQQEGTGMNVERTAEEHDVKSNMKLFLDMIPAFYRILKPGGFCVFWYDMDHHNFLQDLAISQGFKVQRWPLTWVKTHRCMNQSAQYNFTKATEVAMVLRKGTSTLVHPQGVNYYIGSNEEDRAKFSHPFVKPEALWRWIHGAIAIKGQTILDPFAGVGSCPLAAVKGGFSPIAIELNELHYNRLVVEMKALMTAWVGPKTKELVFV